MKNLITTDIGGFPFTLDRLRWMDEGHKEALKALCLSLLPPGATSMILQGCEITATATPGLYNVAAGWVYLQTDGICEICQVDAHQYTVNAGDLVYWNEDVGYPSASVTFFDGSQKQVHQVIKAKVSAGEGGPGWPLITDVPAINGSWVTPATPGWGGTLKYKANKFGLSIKGYVYTMGVLNLFTLPTHLIPAEKVVIPIYTSSSAINPRLQIEDTGLVSIQREGDTGEDDVDFYISVVIPL